MQLLPTRRSIAEKPPRRVQAPDARSVALKSTVVVTSSSPETGSPVVSSGKVRLISVGVVELVA